MSRHWSQCHFYKISKHLIDKPSSFARKEMSYLCFSDDQYGAQIFCFDCVSEPASYIHFGSLLGQ